jgi:hypothetical protein
MIIESRQRSNDSTTLSTRMTPQPRSLLNPRNRKDSVKISQLVNEGKGRTKRGRLTNLFAYRIWLIWLGLKRPHRTRNVEKKGPLSTKVYWLWALWSPNWQTPGKGKLKRIVKWCLFWPLGYSAGHIPYRDSKLTRILQTSLSGQAKVVVICTISPSVLAVDESINTLKFATRVKKIVLTAKNDAVRMSTWSWLKILNAYTFCRWRTTRRFSSNIEVKSGIWDSSYKPQTTFFYRNKSPTSLCWRPNDNRYVHVHPYFEHQSNLIFFWTTF